MRRKELPETVWQRIHSRDASTSPQRAKAPAGAPDFGAYPGFARTRATLARQIKNIQAN